MDVGMRELWRMTIPRWPSVIADPSLLDGLQEFHQRLKFQRVRNYNIQSGRNLNKLDI